MTDQSQDTGDNGTAGDGTAIGDAVENLDTGNAGGADDANKDGASGDDGVKADGEKSGDDKAKGDQGKDGDDGKPSGAPEAYDTAAFKMPEGVEFDAEGFEAVEPVLRELNLNQDQAGKLMEAYGEKIVPMIEARTEKRIDDLGNKLKSDLAKELQADEKVGGEHLEESKALSAKAIHAYLPNKEEREQFTKFLSESGMGNNRFLMRVLVGAGRELGEAGTPTNQGGGEAKTTTQKFYGDG